MFHALNRIHIDLKHISLSCVFGVAVSVLFCVNRYVDKEISYHFLNLILDVYGMYDIRKGIIVIMDVTQCY